MRPGPIHSDKHAPLAVNLAKVIQVSPDRFERRFSAALLLDQVETHSTGAFRRFEDPTPRRVPFPDQRRVPARVVGPVRTQHGLNPAGISFDECDRVCTGLPARPHIQVEDQFAIRRQ